MNDKMPAKKTKMRKGTPTVGRREMSSRRQLLMVLSLFAVFIAVKGAGFKYGASDENIHFYMGKLISEGKMPYRDFFFSHPPLGIYLNALIFKLLGFSFVALKAVPVIATLVGGIFLYKACSVVYDGRTALTALALFLFSYTVLSSTSYSTHVSETVMLMLAGFYLFVRKSYLASGILLGAASSAGVYAVVLLGALAAGMLVSRAGWMRLLALLFGFTVVFVAVNGFFLMSAGEGYFRGVYLYHLMKRQISVENASVILRVMSSNFLVVAPALASPLLFWRRKAEDADTAAASAVISYALFIVSLKTVFDYYFVLLFPFLAILSARGVDALSGRLKDRRVIAGFGVVVVLYSCVSVGWYIDRESRYFESAERISGFVRSNTDPGDEIFGDSTTTPLIALLSQRRIAYDEIDTNLQRFTSNVTDLSRLLDDLHGDGRFKLFIVSERGISTINETGAFINRFCKVKGVFRDAYYGIIGVYDCSGD
ncbi:MAG: glycosyltransferase family 39 protein [Candidatus Altiarchaeota archaeon]